MNGASMLVNTLESFRAGLRQAAHRIAPRGGFFDTIFDSYDDWREFQAQQPAEPSKKGDRESASEA
jgi:hypothetical protein